MAAVSITKVDGGYPSAFPFDPDFAYPEYKGESIATVSNPVYAAVRESFRCLGLDKENFGEKHWNPLGDIIKPGNRIFIKPNLVTHEYRKSCTVTEDLYSVITHPSVIRAVTDYAAIALKGKGEIVIGDNPSIDADFKKLSTITGLGQFEKLYRTQGVDCRVIDLRPQITEDLNYYGCKSKTVKQTGDPEGQSIINLGKHSFFFGMNPLFFRGVFTKRWETIKHHHGKIHEYSISNTILNSDTYISIPKLKSHKKVGATLNIKGLVGINANKNFLVHWRIGFPKTGGDEFAPPRNIIDYILVGLRHLMIDLLPDSLFYSLKRHFKGSPLEILFEDTQCMSFAQHRGAWPGNDTCWRMAADLYNTFVKDLSGWRKKHNKKLRTFSVIDGVLAGEKNGPFCPSPKKARVVVAGQDLLLTDCVGARLMDYNISEIKYLKDLLHDNGIKPESIQVKSEDFEVNNFFDSQKHYYLFQPPSNWNNLSLLN